MADKHNDTVIINLDKPYDVTFSHVAIKRFSAIHEMQVNQIPAALSRYDLATDIIFLSLNSENPAMSREDLLTAVWGYHYTGETRTVDVHIQRLRGKIGTDRIETIVRYGYRFREES